MALASKWSTSPRSGSRRSPLASTRALGALVLLALAPVDPALAAGPDDACIRDERCREHHDKAIKLYTDGYYDEALVEFQAAYEARKLPLLLINIGRTMQKLGRPKEAIAYYERFLAAESKPDAEVLKRVNSYLSQAKALMGPDGSDPNQPKPAGDGQPSSPAGPAAPPPPPPGRSLLIAGGVIAGVGVIGLLTGVGLYASSQGEFDRFKGSADEFEKLAAKSSAQSLGIGSTVSYAIGAAALVTGGALIGLGAKRYVDHRRGGQAAPGGTTPPAAPKAALFPTANGAAAVVMGEF